MREPRPAWRTRSSQAEQPQKKEAKAKQEKPATATTVLRLDRTG